MEITPADFILDKYLKHWYQILSRPHWYEPPGTHNVTADYSRRPDGTVAVLNRLETRTQVKELSGTLIPTNDLLKFKVRLERAVLGFAVTAPYDLVAVYADEEGEYVAAIVGGDSTYVLSAAPQIECQLLAAIRTRLGEREWRRLNYTAQVCPL